MKKLVIVLAVIAVIGMTTGNVVQADPGPYGPVLTVDGCDASPDAIATPCMAGNGLDVYNAVNTVFTNAGFADPAYANNQALDSLQVTSAHAYWKDLSAGAASGFARISITAANTNTLGLFPIGDPGSVKFFPPGVTGTQFLGDGSVGDPYPGALNPFNPANFGFALKSVGNTGTDIWYSDPGLNADGIDHMIAYHLPGLAGAEIWVEVDTNDDGVLDDTVKIVLDKDTYLLAWEDRNVNHGAYDADYNDSIQLITRVQPIPEPMTVTLLGSGLVGLAGLRRRKRS